MDPILNEIRKAQAEMMPAGGAPFAKFDPSLAAVRGPAPLAQAAAITWMLDNADQMPIFPKIVVEQQSGEYREWPRNVLHAVKAQPMSVGDEAKNVYDAPEFKTYDTRMYGLQAPVFDKVIANQNAQVDYVTKAGQNLAQAMSRVLIDEFINVALQDGVWTFNAAGVASKTATFTDPSAANQTFTRWDVYTQTDNAYDSNPIKDVRACRLAMMARTGYTPNVLYLTPDVVDVLIQHPGLIARVNAGQTTGAAQPTLQQIAELFGEGLTIKVIKSVGRDNVGDNSDFLVKQQALLGYIPDTAVMDDPSAGYCFAWNMGMSMNEAGAAVDQYRDDAKQCNVYRIQSAFKFQIVAADLGCRLKNVIA